MVNPTENPPASTTSIDLWVDLRVDRRRSLKIEENQMVSVIIGGEGGIRTLDGLLTHTHFPGVLLQPLGHLSNGWQPKPATPRRTSLLLPLLPSRPDGAHNVSSRGDRSGSPLRGALVPQPGLFDTMAYAWRTKR